MKVFLSWSGLRSKAVAELLRDWIRCVLQATRPWISTRDLDRGSIWFGEISDQLKETSVGIVCLTHENKNRPWILFEAGALAKGLTSSRVCTFLVDLTPKDLEDPLAQFNHTFPIKESMFGLIETLNNSLGANALDHRILQQIFTTYWPQFEQGFANALKTSKPEEPAKPRPEEDILAEILSNTRSLTSRVARIEARGLADDAPLGSSAPSGPTGPTGPISPRSDTDGFETIMRHMIDNNIPRAIIRKEMRMLGATSDWIESRMPAR